MTKQTAPVFRFGLMCAGMIFLCNPNLNLLDLLPDFVGFLLLATSLSEASEAFPHFKEAKEGFIKLAWISLSKIPAAAMMLSIWSGDNSQGSIITVFSLCYAIVELMLLLPTFSHFFEGISYVNQRGDDGGAPSVPPAFGKLSEDGFSKMTLGFFILRSVMSTLPEFSLISVRQYDPNLVFEGSRVVLSSYYYMFAFVGFGLVLICGIVWVAMMLKYLHFLRDEGRVNRQLALYYEDKAEYLAKKRRATRVSTALILLLVAVGFSVDLIFDDFNVLPDTISALMCCAALWMLRSETSKAVPSALCAGVYGVISGVAWGLKAAFFIQYEYRDITLVSEAKTLYLVYAICEAVAVVAFLVTVAAVMRVLRDVLRRFPTKEEQKEERLSRKAGKQMLVFGILGALAGISSFLGVFINADIKFEAMEGVSTLYAMPSWEWYWMIPLVLSLLWLTFSYWFVDERRAVVLDTVDE